MYVCFKQLKWFASISILIVLVNCRQKFQPYSNQFLFNPSVPFSIKTFDQHDQLVPQIKNLIENLKKFEKIHKKYTERRFSYKLNRNPYYKKMFQKEKNLKNNNNYIIFEKRGERRCGQKLIQHLQRVCNNCIRTPDTEQMIMKDKRISEVLHSLHKRGNFFYVNL